MRRFELSDKQSGGQESCHEPYLLMARALQAEFSEVFQQSFCIGVAGVWAFGEEPQDQGFKGSRDRQIELERGGGFLRLEDWNHLAHCLAVKRWATGQQGIQSDSQAVLIGSKVNGNPDPMTSGEANAKSPMISLSVVTWFVETVSQALARTASLREARMFRDSTRMLCGVMFRWTT